MATIRPVLAHGLPTNQRYSTWMKDGDLDWEIVSSAIERRRDRQDRRVWIEYRVTD